MFFFIILILLSSCTPKQDYINVVDSIVSKETKKIRKEEQLEFFGYGGAMSEGIKSISLTFVSRQKVEIAEARQKIVRCIERIRNKINAQENLKEYLRPYPFTISEVKLGILFLQENGKFMEYGCVWLGTGGVSSVFQQNGKLFYSSYNPRTDLLESYFNETYEEALAIVNSDECIDSNQE